MTERRDSIQFKKNIPLSRHTTFKIGGPADYFIAVRSIKKLKQVVEYANENGMPFLFIGGGSNLLVCDRGVRGIVIKNGIKGIRRKGNSIIARSGEKLSRIVDFAMQNRLSGLEFASGIPGTLGGAVYGNAGAYGKCMGDVLVKAKIMKRDGNILDVDNDYFHFLYRWSGLKNSGGMLLEAEISLSPGCGEDICCEIERIVAERRRKHPAHDVGCAGSYFKNLDPPRPGARRIAAGKLLEQVGAKAMRVGNAVVFEGHANFLTNPGGAKCEDMLKLVDLLKKRVKERFGIELKEEIIYIDEEI
ncbi:MAG: UDP-N-acetylmuramate dehydrogenase [Candidatus Eremiobacteraeota bacterium]|nr:UDP-N-acetylmuramate dehydrogenase [Candidatus Eremiobacteraeota bacterium]